MPQQVLCPRCSRPCQVSDRPSQGDARLLRLAKNAHEGLCANCAVTSFILVTETLAYAVELHGPAKVLLMPEAQAGFAELFKVGNADADISEINWQVVVDNWELPFPAQSKSKKRSRK